MKHNWEYRPLGDCFSYIKNGANIKQSKDAVGFPITRIETLANGVFNRDRVGFADITDLSKYKNYILRDGDLLMSHINSKTYVGRTVKYSSKPNELFIHGMNLLRLIPYEWINSQYFYYFTNSYLFKSKIINIRKDAVNQSSFSISDLKKIPTPVPPMEVQEQIVAELDKINELIEQNRELLRQLDSLAQSLFYDTFGDPVTNPKGWDFVQLDNISELKAGKAIKASELSQESVPSSYPCFGGNGLRGYTNEFSHEGTYCIIGRQGALCGNIKIAKGKFYATEHAVVAKPLMKYTTEWFFYTLEAINLNQYATGVAQPGLSVNVINKITIPVPPLSLQQQFAAKIEAIEAQKATIEKSIAELQTLLDSRMDYWFN